MIDRPEPMPAMNGREEIEAWPDPYWTLPSRGTERQMLPRYGHGPAHEAEWAFEPYSPDRPRQGLPQGASYGDAASGITAADPTLAPLDVDGLAVLLGDHPDSSVFQIPALEADVYVVVLL